MKLQQALSRLESIKSELNANGVTFELTEMVVTPLFNRPKYQKPCVAISNETRCRYVYEGIHGNELNGIIRAILNGNF